MAQSGIKVNLLNIPKRISPGSYFNLIFDVESASTFSEPMTVSLKIPETWEILSQKDPEVIIGEKRIKYIFSVNTSMFSPPGNITSRLLINTASGYRIEKPFQIQVLSVRKIIISPVLLPESAKEGDSLKIEYLVENRGNVKDNLKVEALGGKIVGKTDINGLNPDESTNIIANFLVPEGEENSFNFGFGIRAVLKDSLKPINFTNSILVYSKKIKKTERFNRFPISVGFMGNVVFKNKKANYSFQPEISGTGYLDKNNMHYLNFYMRGPSNISNQIEAQYFNNFNIYTLKYKYSKNKFMSTVQIGDYDLQFTPIIENGRFGRGVNFETKYNKIGFYGFYIQPRFFNQQKQTFGGSLYFLPDPKQRVSIDYSSKYYRIKRYVWTNFLGFQYSYKNEKFNIQSGLAGSMYSKKYDFGASTQLNLKINKFNIAGNYLYAGKEFYGFFRDSYLISNTVIVQLSKKISLGADVLASRINSSKDTIFYNISPFSTILTGYSSYKINGISNALFGYTWANIEDRMEPKRFFYQQQFLRLGYNLNSKRLNIFYEGRFGTAKNLLALDDPSIEKLNISNTLRPEMRILPWAWAGLYAQHERTSRFSVQNKLTDLYYYGVTFRLPINNGLSFDLNYTSNFAPDKLTETQNNLLASANINIGNHRFQISGGKRIVPVDKFTILNDLFFLARYSYLLKAPVSRLKNLGNIQGQISVSSEGLKKDGIVMTLGDRKFVSDKDGKFYFKHLVADKYYLDIDQKSLPKGVISNLKLPLEVDLKGDSTSQINLSLTKTGTIVGKVLFTNIENDEDKGKPSVLITLSNDTETLYTRVNKNDEFSCKQVKPGKWSITASIISGNPEDYTITEASQSIEVEADGNVEVEYTIENYKRSIEFNPSTFNVIEEKDDKVSSLIKENSVIKENSISKENSVTKENNINKENSVTKENTITKENVTKENNITKEDNVSKENDDTWTNKTSPVNKTKPKTTPKSKSIVKDVKQIKNTTKSTIKNKTKKQSPKKKPNYTIISI